MGQQFRRERVQPCSQGRTLLPDLLAADQPEGRILGEALRVVQVLIASQTAVDGLPQQIGQRQLGVLSPTRIAQVPFDQFIQTQTSIKLPHQNQATVRRDSRSLEIDLQGAVERKLRGWFCFSPIGC
jgi:hypothetical protein